MGGSFEGAMSARAKIIFLFVIIVLLPVSSLHAREALLSKTLDLSTVQDNRRFYVVLASRGGSSTGHALIVWGTEDDVTQRSTIKALGLYPEGERESDNCGSAVRRVPGRIMDELHNHSVQGITQQLIVRVNEEDFQRSLKVAGLWDCRHEFSLLTRDCVEFLRAVGEVLHVPMPSRLVTRWTPKAYVRALLASISEGRVDLDVGMYTGSRVKEKPIGHGVVTRPDGSRIEGTFWAPDHMVGAGRIIDLVDGFRYEGDIVDFKAQGEGKLWRLGDSENTAPAELLLKGHFEFGRLQKRTRDMTVNPKHKWSRSTSSKERIFTEFGVIELADHS
jgi:hypothetical protein